MRSYRTIILIACLLALDTALVLAAGEVRAPARSELRAGDALLRMSICVATPRKVNESPMFRVSLENVGDVDVILNLGIMLANGKVHLPERIRLILTDAEGQARELHFSDRRFPGVAGRVDDYVLPLRAGSTYIIRLSLDDYWCAKTKEFRLKLKPGQYKVRAEFTGEAANHLNHDTRGIGLMNYWKGELQSDPVAFRIEDQG